MSKLFNHGSYHYFAIINPIPGSWGFASYTDKDGNTVEDIQGVDARTGMFRPFTVFFSPKERVYQCRKEQKVTIIKNGDTSKPIQIELYKYIKGHPNCEDTLNPSIDNPAVVFKELNEAADSKLHTDRIKNGDDDLFVPLPTVATQRARDMLRQTAGPHRGSTELEYVHFSIVMSKSRKMPYFTAVNIDGKSLQRPHREQDVWRFDGAEWSLLTATGPPGPRAFMDLVEDAARGVLVLFGDGPIGEGVTWEFDGTTWVAQNTPFQPDSTRTRSQLAYDSKREVVILFGGRDSGSEIFFNDTWRRAAA